MQYEFKNRGIQPHVTHVNTRTGPKAISLTDLFWTDEIKTKILCEVPQHYVCLDAIGGMARRENNIHWLIDRSINGMIDLNDLATLIDLVGFLRSLKVYRRFLFHVNTCFGCLLYCKVRLICILND